MSFLTEKKHEHETKCEEAIRQKAYRQAVFHAAKAAEFSFTLAHRAGGKLGYRYVDDGEGWLAIADGLKSKKAMGANRPNDSGKIIDKEEGNEPSAEDAWLVTEKPDVSFDQIAGMEQAKNALFDMIVYPLRKPETAKKLKLPMGGGVLLFGPPGTGKTTLAKAAASELDASFFYASGAELRSKWHGESEQRLRDLIKRAQQEPVAILFFDDVDGLLPKRSGKSAVDNRIVVEFLNDIGGFETSDNVMLMLGATNNPWSVDEAVFRTGRFDQKIYVGLPDREARLGILKMHLAEVPVEESVEIENLADRLEGYTGSDIVGIVNAAKRRCNGRSVREDTDPVITADDFDQALRTIPSSVTDQLLQKYDKFREQRFR